jgi:hypothetical protein
MLSQVSRCAIDDFLASNIEQIWLDENTDAETIYTVHVLCIKYQ